MSQFCIRPAGVEDAEEMLALYAPYIINTTVSSEYVPPTLEEFIQRIRTYTAKMPWLCCERDGEIVGYAYASPHRKRAGYQWSCETSIYTKMGYQRMGIASALYGALDEILTYQGYYSIYVGITSPNPKSISFHKAMGFEQMGAYQNSMFKFGQWRDVIWMGKTLRHHAGVPRPTIPYPEIRDRDFCRGVLDVYAERIHETRKA
ncbi:MAG: GNAT family N-acetyltransferase [Butyricicoccus sp.]